MAKPNNAVCDSTDSSFPVPKILAKFPRHHPQRGRQREVGRFLAALCGQYLAISQKRCKIGTQLLWKANRNLCALYQMVLFSMTLGDP